MKKEQLEKSIHNGNLNEFLLVRGYNQNQLIDLADWIYSQTAHWSEIYWLQGSMAGDYYPSFESIRIKSSLILRNKEFKAKSGGLIFPQDKPIILVIEDFNLLNANDQYAYSTIFSREGIEIIDVYLHPNSLVIVSIKPESRINIKNISTWIELD